MTCRNITNDFLLIQGVCLCPTREIRYFRLPKLDHSVCSCWKSSSVPGLFGRSKKDRWFQSTGKVLEGKLCTDDVMNVH